MFRRKWPIFLLLGVVFFSCKKSFTPVGALANTNKYLVIDGFVNTGTDSTFIKLSTTKKFDSLKVVVDPVAGAQLRVESDANINYPLIEKIPGTYAAAGLKLDVSHKYRLRINLSDGREYLSDYVVAKNAPPIDSVGYNALADGVHIYVNSHDAANNTKYYRWDFDETWQFHANLFAYYAPGKYYCFSNSVSNAVNVANTAKLSADVVYQAPIATIPSTSEKLQIKYSILVRQYALTSDAYSFWDNLQKNTGKLGSIFDAQPTLNQTNYHNTANPTELVVGFLSVGSYSSKRIFIPVADLPKTYTVKNGLSCPLDTAYYFRPPYYYPNPPFASVDLSGTYPGYIGIDRSYITPEGPFGAPNFKIYSRTECGDCTVRGNQVTPPFWR